MRRKDSWRVNKEVSEESSDGTTVCCDSFGGLNKEKIENNPRVGSGNIRMEVDCKSSKYLRRCLL